MKKFKFLVLVFFLVLKTKLLKGLELGCSGCISAVTNVTHSLARKVFDDFENNINQTANEKLMKKIKKLILQANID